MKFKRFKPALAGVASAVVLTLGVAEVAWASQFYCSAAGWCGHTYVTAGVWCDSSSEYCESGLNCSVPQAYARCRPKPQGPGGGGPPTP